jgi:Domain of Unknown Function with PDB structure (DUF3857)/Transglutaminase-like superfamily
MGTGSVRAILFAVIVALSISAYGQEWQPVTGADLTSGPVVEKNADAEALFWRIRVEQSMSKTELSHYLRIKVFTDRGIESQGRVDLPYSGKESIKDVSGRTIKPDGTIVPLQPNSIFDRTIAKAKNVKVQVKSIAFPAVTAGSLIEYRWTEVRPEGDPYHIALEVQRDIPVQRVEYTITTLKTPFYVSVNGFNTRTESLGMTTLDSALYPTDRGYVNVSKSSITTAVESVPALHEEPLMPPRGASVPWLLLYYLDMNCVGCSGNSLIGLPSTSAAAQNYWQTFGPALFADIKSFLKLTDDIKRAAASIVRNAATPEEKVKRLYEFCATNIKRINDDMSDISSEARDRFKPNKSVTEVLTRKVGTGRDIDLLFAALVNAAGMEAHYAMLGDHERPAFDPQYPAPFLLNSYNIAVKIDDRWKFLDPAIKYQPFGMLRWQEEGVPALLLDENAAVFVRTPISSAGTSVLKRSGTLRLSEDGTLEGDIKLYFLGHFGANEKEAMDGLTTAEREQIIRERVSRRISSAEITNAQVENEKDPAGIMAESYHVRVPGYAQRTGRRLLFQPGYFQQGEPALFSSNTRINDVFFPYAWTEVDTITIELPPSFQLEDAEQPKPVAAGSSGKHVLEVQMTPDGRTLKYSRLQSFGTDQKLSYPASEYSNIKRIFDVFHELDNHTVSFVQKPQDSGIPQ